MTFFPDSANVSAYWPAASGYAYAPGWPYPNPSALTPPRSHDVYYPSLAASRFAAPPQALWPPPPAAAPFPLQEARAPMRRAVENALIAKARPAIPAPTPVAPHVATRIEKTRERAKTPPGAHPKDWNLSLLIPPLGIASALAWGASSIGEHSLQAGHALKLPFIKTTPAIGRFLTKMAVAAPAINVVYGGLNAVGALAQGYGMRSVAFGAFSLFSLALAPKMLKNNLKALEIGKKLAELPKNPGLKAEIEKLAREGLKLHDISSLYNAVAPIGLLTGLFSITKVAQSTPGILVEHPKGDTIRHMTEEAAPGRSLGDVFWRNMRQEIDSFNDTARHSWRNFKRAMHDFGRAFRNISNPPPYMRDQSTFSRFMAPITDGPAVPLFYSHATLGRVLYSVMAAAMFAGLGGVAIRSKSVYDAALKAIGKTVEAQTPQAQKLNKGLSALLVWGNFSGTPAGLFTRFGDWPLALSSVYRTSGFAYGASALSSALKLSGVQKLGKFYHEGHVFGFDERALTKIGAFIQGTSYFVNLMLKNMGGSAATSARLGESDPGALAIAAH